MAVKLTDSAFDVLRVAVRIAKDRQIKTVKSLKAQLLVLFPDRQAEIDQAVSYWATEVARPA